MSRATGYETMHTAEGNVLQAGVKTKPMAQHHDLASMSGLITRAVVLATYYADEDTAGGRIKLEQKSVVCDVRTYGRMSREIPRVPVLQRTLGLWDYDIYTPRAARQDITGGALHGPGTAQPTSAEKLDGDHVLIGFLDNDPNQAVILPFTVAHPNTNYRPVAADGHVRRIRHNGVLMAWDKEGNFTIDATGGAAEVLGSSGTEVASGGTVSVSGVAVKLLSDDVELGNGAGEAVVKGDLFASALIAVLNGLAGFSTSPILATALVKGFNNLKSAWLSSKVKVG